MATSSTTSDSSSPSIQSPSPQRLLIPSNPQLTVKLNPTNYLLWRAQINPLLRCNRLIGHIDGTLPPPPLTVESQPNPAYATWYENDQVVLAWINLSLTEAVMPTIVNKTTARDAWDALTVVYASGSPVIIGQLRKNLIRLSRDNETIHDYIHRAKAIYDKMLALGATVTEQEPVIALLDGLDEDYRPFTRNLEACLEPISFENVSSLLLSEEIQLQRFQSASVDSAPPQTVYSARGGRNGGRYSRDRGPRFAGRGFSQPSRFSNPYFAGRPISGESRPASSGLLGVGPSSPSMLVCHNCGGKGHKRPHCLNPFISAQPTYTPGPASHLAQSSHPAQSSSQWLLDSGANHHLTSDLGKLIHHSEYNGPDQVTFGDDKCLPITHSSSSTAQISTRSYVLDICFMFTMLLKIFSLYAP
ncbi:unnamed protein product [Linum trigynum]|uniref:CCHC-type domain-containing protein n=1 Tax=Linum trigynum TaxID=586398 RepID=A0AAV2CZT2_9ROSI